MLFCDTVGRYDNLVKSNNQTIGRIIGVCPIENEEDVSLEEILEIVYEQECYLIFDGNTSTYSGLSSSDGLNCHWLICKTT